METLKYTPYKITCNKQKATREGGGLAVKYYSHLNNIILSDKLRNLRKFALKLHSHLKNSGRLSMS